MLNCIEQSLFDINVFRMGRRECKKSSKCFKRSRPGQSTSSTTEVSVEDARIHQLELQLLDPFSEVTTPEGTDDESEAPPMPVLPFGPNLLEAREDQLEQFLEAELVPEDPDVPYYSLYSQPDYRNTCRRKLVRLRRYARHCNFPLIFASTRFWRYNTCLRDMYGYRRGLTCLISIYHFCRDVLEGIPTPEPESESDSDSDSNSPPSKFPKPDPDQDPDQGPSPIAI